MSSGKIKFRYIPQWIWKPLALSLGIRENGNGHPIVSLILYLILLTSCMLFASSSLWFTFYHIKKLQLANGRIFNEAFTIIFGAFWCSIALYGNKLAYKTLTTKQLVKSIRLHTKTFLKMNLGLIVSCLSILFITLLLINMSKTWMDPQTCQAVSLPHWLCFLSFLSLVVLSVLSTVWNLTLFIIILSIARTHTLLLREFIKELDLDALARHRLHLLNNGPTPFVNTFRDVPMQSLGLNAFDWTVQFEESDDENLLESYRKHKNNPTIQPLQDFSELQRSTPSTSVDSLVDHDDVPRLLSNATVSVMCPSQSRTQLRDLIASGTVDQEAYSPFILSDDQLTNHYWILQRRLRVVSHVFQRWVVSWIGFVVLWILSYIIHWLANSVRLIDLALFAVPLVLILQLFASYSEVNNEAESYRKYIYPTRERLPLLRFLFSQPLQLSVFNMPVNYTTVLSIILVFAVAFISRIVVDEMNTHE